MKLFITHTVTFRRAIIVCLLFNGLSFCAFAQDSTVHPTDANTDSLSAWEQEDAVEETNDEFTGSYFNDSAGFRAVPDSTVEKLKTDRDFLYANDSSYWSQNKKSNDSALLRWLFAIVSSPVFEMIIYILLVLLLLFIIYQVVIVNKLFVFSRSAKRRSAGDIDDKDIRADDLDEKIRVAIDGNDHRLAIRWLYLKTLKFLHNKNQIALQAKATNQEYLRQMKQFPGFGAFGFLTRVYEYTWYGGFQPGKEQFDVIHENFNRFIVEH